MTGNRLANEIAQWKEAVAERWDSITVVSKDTYDAVNGYGDWSRDKIRIVVDEQCLNDAIG